MSNRTAARLAWSIWVLCVPLTVFGGLLSLLTGSGQIGAGSGMVILLGVLLLTFPTAGCPLGVGGLWRGWRLSEAR